MATDLAVHRSLAHTYAAYGGVPFPAASGRPYDNLDTNELAHLLLMQAGHVDPLGLRKHKRGPKVPKWPGCVSGAEARRHVSTAQVLKQGRVT